MATIRKRNGRFNVEIRKRGVRAIYETFDLKSDAQSFINKVGSEIQQRKYKDISEASNTSFKTVLHRYLREKIKDKSDKRRERSKLSVILRNPIHLFFHMYLMTLNPLFGHTDFVGLLIKGKKRLAIGHFDHQLHHRYFDCNYRTSELPLDDWFGSFHNGTPESNIFKIERR